MTYREESAAPETLQQRVVQACESGIPLGAYADDASVFYLFLRPEGVHALSARLGVDRQIDPVAPMRPLFDWDEREMHDLYGIATTGQASSRPLFIKNGKIPQALTAEGPGITVIVVGPVHAGITEPGRFTLSTGGETVIHLDGQFTYSHRGVEKFLEGKNAIVAAPLLARVCGACSVSRSFAYARALEALAGVQIAREAELMRVILAELERLYNHVFDLGQCASGSGWGPGLTAGLTLKERFMRLNASVGSHRMLFDTIVPGGVRPGMLTNDADRAALRRELDTLRSDVAAFAEKFFRNRSVVQRLQGAGVVDTKTAKAFGAVGPAGRASGVDLDVRRYAPYGAYQWLTLAPVKEHRGDAMARAAVKRAEIVASFDLINEALDMLGSATIPTSRLLQAKAGTTSIAVEGPRGAEIVSVRCDALGVLQRVHIRSSSYRNWPLVLRAMEGNIVPDFPLVNKSFNLCYACADR